MGFQSAEFLPSYGSFYKKIMSNFFLSKPYALEL